jgi:hypothetical protein
MYGFNLNRTLLIIVGVLVLFIAIVIPLGDTLRLLGNPSFVFFLGQSLPVLTVVTCLGAILAFAALIWLLLNCCSREESQGGSKRDVALMVAFFTITLCQGLAFLAISTPLESQATIVYNELVHGCQMGSYTGRLSEHYNALQDIRYSPECSTKKSLEQCRKYQFVDPSPEEDTKTSFLKELETQYKCSGFCGVPVASTNAGPAATRQKEKPGKQQQEVFFLQGSSQGSRGGSSLLPFAGAAQTQSEASRVAAVQRSGTSAIAPGRLATALRQLANGTSVRAAAHAEGKAGERERELPNFVGDTPGYLDDLPLMLFRPGKGQVSCEGAAARSLKYGALDVADSLQFQGYVQLAVSVAGLLFIVAFHLLEGGGAEEHIPVFGKGTV